MKVYMLFFALVFSGCSDSGGNDGSKPPVKQPVDGCQTDEGGDKSRDDKSKEGKAKDGQPNLYFGKYTCDQLWDFYKELKSELAEEKTDYERGILVGSFFAKHNITKELDRAAVGRLHSLFMDGSGRLVEMESLKDLEDKLPKPRSIFETPESLRGPCR